MQTRESVLEKFSTFLQFDTDWVSRWVSDPKLQRSMKNCLAQSSQSQQISEHFWALYWHKIWQTQSNHLSAAHLTAYLQEVSYWTAKKMMLTFSSSQSFADLFQISLTKIEKILAKFEPQQGVTLEKYASLVFRSIIRDELRQRREVDICSDWGLLHKLSQKKLLESLRYQGLKSETINELLKAWKCFQTIFVPTEARNSRKIPEPDPAIWTAITQLYNKQSTQKPLTSEQVKKLLETGAKMARSYLYPKFVSVDAPKPGFEQGTFLDDLPATFDESLLSEIIAQEEAENRNQMRSLLNAVLLRALVKLDVPSQKLLQLYYGQGLTQQEIAQQLEMKQYTVSRRLASHRQSLLLTLAQWSQTTLHYSLNTDVLNNMSIILEEWLKVHYNHPDQA
ncbi:group 3/4 sigma-70 RNA polymerase sigma factor [Aphanothece hegewaldii CCALA 016]|uniref:Group 3/4 sigma-70 RNA polymerase sigma factor n=1 Tax=Aphanothece hegewaldii CCALA 016 TaxID=2107694 RepID=A0A2T1LZB1_9CHRO|nr:sigma-70 family RNA polymerase sigma factor [Aphanothece hegewaldii]PSF37742.1 group 3/4 sigma-70 RNA polymerase sigma factor [Aphanothece hegewaldii CCALA 016]